MFAESTFQGLYTANYRNYVSNVKLVMSGFCSTIDITWRECLIKTVSLFFRGEWGGGGQQCNCHIQ